MTRQSPVFDTSGNPADTRVKPPESYRRYPGGFTEYVIENAASHVLFAVPSKLDPPYGGDPDHPPVCQQSSLCLDVEIDYHRSTVTQHGEPASDFWLGDRGEGKVTDFDGRLRACRILKRIRLSDSQDSSHLLVHVEPPLPLSSGKSVDHVVLGPRWEGHDLEDLPSRTVDDEPSYLAVHIFEVVDERAVASGVIEPRALRHEWYGEIALRPDLLPATQENNFDHSFRLLEQFVVREGTADVPLYHLEKGVGLGVWVSNMRFEQANMGLREDWAARLESLPGWKWLPGNDFFLVERYAQREGTTRIPEDYVEEGRPLGRWVAQQRRLHASGQLAKDWVARLERIPGWEW